MTITINQELLQYIDPLTANEYAALERSLLAEGCRDALVLWGDVLIDGHNRYEICSKYNIEFKTIQNSSFQSIEEVMLWMIDNQLGRRSVTDFQRGVLALRKRDLISARVQAEMDATRPAKTEEETDNTTPASTSETAAPTSPIKTREDIARVAGISSNTIGQIEKIRKTAAPELVEAVRAGAISINAAAAVATLPSEEQVSAVAGGKKQLREAAKMVREKQAASRPPRVQSDAPATAEANAMPSYSNDTVALQEQIAALKNKVAELVAENQGLHDEIARLRSGA